MKTIITGILLMFLSQLSLAQTYEITGLSVTGSALTVTVTFTCNDVASSENFVIGINRSSLQVTSTPEGVSIDSDGYLVYYGSKECGEDIVSTNWALELGSGNTIPPGNIDAVKHTCTGAPCTECKFDKNSTGEITGCWCNSTAPSTGCNHMIESTGGIIYTD